jgi:predicted nucleic acid-binding protein
MTFDQIPQGADVFLDANSLVYHFTNDPAYGAPCSRLVKRIEQRSLRGIVSTHDLADVIHRLMERAEYATYVMAGEVVAILQAQARLLLARRDPA